MKRLLASAATAALLASPLSALAAPTSGELFARLANLTTPSQTTGEVHGYNEGTYFSAWFNGSQQGKMGAPDAKAKMKITVDVVQGDMKVRVKLEMRAMEKTMYFKVDAVEGDFGNLISWDVLQKTWVKMTLDESTMMEALTPMMLQSMLSDPSLQSMIDGMFTLTEERYQGGKAYTLKPSDMMLSEMNVSAESIENMTIRINTANDGTPNYAGIDAKVEEPNGGWVTVTGNIQRTNGNVYVEIPKGALSWEEFQSQLDGMFGMESMMSDWPMMGMPGGVEWMNEENNWGETDDWNSPSLIMPCRDMNSDAPWPDEDWIPCDTGDTPTTDTGNQGMYTGPSRGIRECGDLNSQNYWQDIDSYWSDADMGWHPCTTNAELPTWFDTCTAEQGTPDYLFQMRKGLCPMTGPSQGSRDEKYRQQFNQQQH